MGIINLTPDSFFKGSRNSSDKSLLTAVEKMILDGATIIDVGGYSTRPNAEFVSQDEEILRLSRGLEVILVKFPEIIISIDTFRSSVVRNIVNNFNIAMVNDIGGGTLDDLMFETIADLNLSYVLMHIKGNPKNMQYMTNYNDIVSEIIHFFEKKISQLRLLGVNDVIIDPGFGFAKTIEQNYLILSKLHYFKELNVPILAGLSRKSMLYNLLNIDSGDALNASTSANTLALVEGASILRVHDVKEAMQAISIFNKYSEKI